MKEHIIYQDYVYENEADYEEAYIDYINSNSVNPDDYPIDEFMRDEAEFRFEAEQSNLNIEIPEGIIQIADLGLWDGRRSGYGRYEPSNIKECLKFPNGGYGRIYVKNNDLIMTEAHHDGTNIYRFRKWKPTTTANQKNKLRLALWSNDPKADDYIKRFTTGLGKDIGKVYGW